MMNVTMRQSMLLLLPLLLGADSPTRPQASLVSLDGRPQTLAAAAAELGKQANVAIDTERADAQRIVNLRMTNVPFWEAFDRLARATDSRVQISGQGARIALIRGPYRPKPVSISGPFRFIASRTLGRLEFDSGISQTEVTIEVAWESSFKAYYLELDPSLLSATDSQARALNLLNEGSTRIPVTSAVPELTIKLRGVPRETTRIARLEGAVKILGTTQMLQFVFPLTEQMSSMKRAEVTGTLASMRKNVRLWTAVVELEYPRDMPKFESFQSFLLDNEAWLLRGDGTKFPVRKFELGFERDGKFPITYYIPENDKDGPMLGDRKDWKLVVRLPGRIVEEKVPFRLQDVPLP